MTEINTESHSPFLPGTKIQYAWALKKAKWLIANGTRVPAPHGHKVDCLISHLSPNAKGYIPIGFGRAVKMRAHRVIFFCFNPTVDPSRMVLHSCDRRNCIEQTHLFDGTAKDNTQDMMMKSRNKYILPNNQKVDPVLVQLLADEGMTGAAIAEKLGVSTSSISNYIGKNGVYRDN
jgi:hypothetical protein